MAAAGAAAALAAPASAQAATSSLEAIRASGRVRVGLLPAEPWALKDPADNQWRGFSVSFAKAVAEVLGVKLEMEEVTFTTAVAPFLGAALAGVFGSYATMLKVMAVVGLAAAALEFALEGLHLNRRLAKDSVGGRAVYGAR